MKERLINAFFVSLIFVIGFDFNGFFSSFFGTTAFLSPLILLITMVLFLFSVGIESKLPPLTTYLFSLFFLWLFVGSIMTIANTGAFPIQKIRYYLPSVAMLYVFSKMFIYYIWKEKWSFIFNIITVSLILNSISVIFLQYFGGVFGEGDRGSGFIASINQAGVTMSITQVFILYQFLFRDKYKYFLLFFYGVSMYAAILTFSKAAFLNVIIIAGTFLWFLLFNRDRAPNRTLINRRNKKILFKVMLVFIPAIFFYLGLWINNLSRYQLERLNEFGLLLGGTIDEETTTGRSKILTYAWDKIRADNFLGEGLGSFHAMEGIGYGTHNEFILILGEIGIIGIILYIVYFLIVYYKLLLSNNSEFKFLVLSLVNVLVITSMVAHTVLFTKLYILMFALINTLVYVDKRHNFISK